MATKSITTRLSLVSAEAERIIDDVDRAAAGEELEQMYKEWDDRLVLRFVDDPEGLQRARDAVANLHISTLANQLESEVMRDEYIEEIKAYEETADDKHSAIDAALALRQETDCPGPQTKKVGFLARKTVQLCGLEHTSEFQRIRELHDRDRARYEEIMRQTGGNI